MTSLTLGTQAPGYTLRRHLFEEVIAPSTPSRDYNSRPARSSTQALRITVMRELGIGLT